jgi:HSP20 family protein
LRRWVGWTGSSTRSWGTRRAAPTGRPQPEEFAVPSADVVAEGDDVLINLELPGVDVARDVVVEIDRGRLVVRGQRGGRRENERGGRVHRERWSGSFRREFRLPERVDASRISAGYERGVLTVRLAGAAVEPKATRIAVTAAHADDATPEVGQARPSGNANDAPAAAPKGPETRAGAAPTA